MKSKHLGIVWIDLLGGCLLDWNEIAHKDAQKTYLCI